LKNHGTLKKTVFVRQKNQFSSVKKPALSVKISCFVRKHRRSVTLASPAGLATLCAVPPANPPCGSLPFQRRRTTCNLLVLLTTGDFFGSPAPPATYPDPLHQRPLLPHSPLMSRCSRLRSASSQLYVSTSSSRPACCLLGPI
jgi:hypothetical protein